MTKGRENVNQILVKRPNEELSILKVESDNLENKTQGINFSFLVNLVGNDSPFIEMLHFNDDIKILVDEEGYLKHGIASNFIYRGHVIKGNAVFCASTNGEFTPLNNEQIELISDFFSTM